MDELMELEKEIIEISWLLDEYIKQECYSDRAIQRLVQKKERIAMEIFNLKIKMKKSLKPKKNNV